MEGVKIWPTLYKKASDGSDQRWSIGVELLPDGSGHARIGIAYGKVGGAHFFGLPGNPVSVMMTFYEFVRDALLILQGRRDVPPLPTLQAALAGPIRKIPGRTEFQRGVLVQDGDRWTVRTTGEQGSGVLSSMSQANCFIVLPADAGDLVAGTVVDVQLLEGLV